MLKSPNRQFYKLDFITSFNTMSADLKQLIEESDSSKKLDNEQFHTWVGLFTKFKEYLYNPSEENKEFREEFVNGLNDMLFVLRLATPLSQ